MAKNKQDEELLEEELEEEIEEEEEGNVQPSKPQEKKSNVSPMFKKTIKKYLDSFAAIDEPFEAKYENPDKNLDDCCNYIFNQVKKSGCCGFADDEIYQMARHYYQEEIDKNDLTPVNGKVVVNHQVELSEDDKKKAYEQALKEYKDKVIKEEENKAKKAEITFKKQQEAEIKKAENEKKKLEEKEAKRNAEIEEAKKQGAGVQTSLFDFI